MGTRFTRGCEAEPGGVPKCGVLLVQIVVDAEPAATHDDVVVLAELGHGGVLRNFAVRNSLYGSRLHKYPAAWNPPILALRF